MLARGITRATRRMYSTTNILAANADAVTDSNALTLNFCTPHTPIYTNKVVDTVLVPGDDGEFGVMANLTPTITQLSPGVVTVVHTGGESEKYFVSGGFAIIDESSTANVSCAEAIPLSDFDEAAVKSGYAEATKAAASADEEEKVEGLIQQSTYAAIARAIGVSV